MATAPYTRAQAEADYDANASYDSPPNVPACQAFVKACRCLIRHAEEMSRGNAARLRFSLTHYQAQLDSAVRWLAHSPDALAAQNSPAVTVPDFTFCRDY